MYEIAIKNSSVGGNLISINTKNLDEV